MRRVLTSNGVEIDQDPSVFGRFRDSSRSLDSAEVLRSRLAADGYLFLRGVLDVDLLSMGREIIVEELSCRRLIDHSRPISHREIPARSNVDLYEVLECVGRNDAFSRIAEQDALRQLFSSIFGSQAAALDYKWPRVAGPGRYESPHCDWVYMCRGTKRLLTTWIPLMDVPLELGPLIILEDSHLDNPHTREYLKMDVDALGLLNGLRLKHGTMITGGRYSTRPDKVRAEFGTRWLCEDFRLGDLVLFNPRGLHTTLDNSTNGFRLSVDMRYQPTEAAKDPRFVGVSPTAHKGRRKSIYDVYASLRSALIG